MEYQYYEFQTLDRPLTEQEKAYVRTLSSRVKPTANRAVFTYSHGDFRGKPEELLAKCFDAMLYEANWGTRRLMFRLPKAIAPVEALQPYCISDIITLTETADRVLLDINIDDETASVWVEEDQEQLSELLPLRDALLQGDYRALYLAWLQVVSLGLQEDEDPEEPPVPANLNHLCPALTAWVEWLGVDADLIAAASEVSPEVEKADEPVADWLAALSNEEKEDWLLRVLAGDPHVGMKLMASLRERFAEPRDVREVSASAPRRTFSQLEAIAQTIRQQREQREQKLAQQKRRKHLDSLSGREDKLWESIHQLISRKNGTSYDEAVAHLVDLRDLAEMQGTLPAFQARCDRIQTDYSRLPGLMRRLRSAGL